jgi:cell division protein FtsB
MSPVAAPARKPAPSRRAPAKPARPNLRVVTPVPSRAPRAPFVLFSMLVVGLGLVGLLVLNTVVAQDAFTLHDLDRNAAQLAEREQALKREVAALEAPAAVAARATKLGLVPAGDPVFLKPDGTVLGHPVPATAPPAPPPPPAPSASASPKPKPKPSPTAAP